MQLWVIALVLIFAVLVLFLIFFWRFRQRQPFRFPLTTHTDTSRNPQNQPSPELRGQLIRRMSGDQAAAERLVAQAKRKNPGHPEAWYWEKVISDLEQDRR